MEKLKENLSKGQPTAIQATFSMVLSLVFWLVFGPMLATMFSSFKVPYLTANAPFLAMALGILVSKELLFHVSFTTLATDFPVFRISLFFKSFGAYLAVSFLFLGIGFLVNSASYTLLHGSWTPYFLLLPLVVILTPIQTSCEEIVFRILPLRAVQGESLNRDKMRNLFAILLSALMFAAPHLSNRELSESSNPFIVLAFYALFGALVSYISIKNGGFESALAIHAANNLFVALVCNYEGSSLPSLSIFTTTMPVGSLLDLLQLILGLGAVLLVTRKEIKQRSKSL